MKKWIALSLSLVLTAFMMAGCGGSGSSTAAGSAPVASAPAGEASEPASEANSEAAPEGETAAGGGLDAIKAAGKLVMMTNATFPPYEYVGPDGVVGVDQELAQKVADKIGVELEILDMNFDLLVAALQGGKGDLVAAGMTITPERLEEVDFSVPYVDTTLLIIVPEGSDITGPADLDGKTIAVQENTTSDIFVSGAEDFTPKEVMRFKSAVDAGNAVSGGKADVAVIDEMTAKNVVAANEGKLVLLEEELGREQYAMAVAKGNADLLAVVNEVLQAEVDAGAVDELIAKHMELSHEG